VKSEFAVLVEFGESESKDPIVSGESIAESVKCSRDCELDQQSEVSFKDGEEQDVES
jgi:hypothetical protein